MIKQFILIILITTTVFSAPIKIDLFTGEEIPIKSKVDGSYTVTLDNKTIKLMQGKSSFNCDGKLTINGELLEDLNKMFKTFGADAQSAVKSMVSEMATQAGIELSIEMLARLHYMLLNGLTSGSSILIAIKAKDIAQCFTSGFYNSLESDLEGGIGSNIYDLLSGRVGVNFVSIAGIYPCVKKVLGDPKDADAKKKLEKSRQWVRFLLYKLLNSSMDDLFNLQLSAGELDPKCKELNLRIKNNNFPISMAQLGRIITPTGTEFKSEIKVMEPTRVGKKIPDPKTPSDDKIKKDDEAKANGNTSEIDQKTEEIETEKTAVDSQSELTDDEKTEAKKALDLKKKANDPYIKEVSIKTVLTEKPNDYIIDMTDLSEIQIINLNKFMYDNIKNIMLKENNIYKQSIKDSFFKIIKKILTITTDNQEMLDSRKKLLEIKDPETGVFLYDNTTILEKILKTKYYGKLYKFAYTYLVEKNGLLEETEKNFIKTNILQTIPTTQINYNSLIKIAYNQKIIRKLNKWEIKKYYIASGENLILNGSDRFYNTKTLKDKLKELIYNEYQYDLQTYRGASGGSPDTSISDRINANIVLRKPLHELEYLRILYELESREILLQIMGTNAGENIGTMYISSKIQNNQKNDAILIDYTIKRIKILKQLYAVELLDTYAKRSDSIKSWMMNFYQQHKINKVMQDFFIVELEKFKFKQKQKRLLIKLLLEKDVK